MRDAADRHSRGLRAKSIEGQKGGRWSGFLDFSSRTPWPRRLALASSAFLETCSLAPMCSTSQGLWAIFRFSIGVRLWGAAFWALIAILLIMGLYGRGMARFETRVRKALTEADVLEIALQELLGPLIEAAKRHQRG